MNAAFTPTYGSADVIEIRDLPSPAIGDHDVLVEVHATPVTAGDRRLRSADFPGVTAGPGRLAMGLFRPRNAVQGTMFAGRVAAVGNAVTRYVVGDDVFGGATSGAYAELLSMHEDGPMAKMPEGMDYAQVAAIPYGAGTALHFLRDMADVKPADKVLVVGASGGVGRYAVQLAKHMGAEVTGIASRRNAELVRGLGADHVIDHETVDFTRSGLQYDVILDIADATSFGRCRSSLTPNGRYLSLFISLGLLFHMAVTALTGGRRAMVSVAIPSRSDMEDLRALMAEGVLRSNVVARFPLARIVDAHAAADAGGSVGEVMVDVGRPMALRAVG
jgi:NADPH:quinone reductase-like Zn-dependent oxidoreductase